MNVNFGKQYKWFSVNQLSASGEIRIGQVLVIYLMINRNIYHIIFLQIFTINKMSNSLKNKLKYILKVYLICAILFVHFRLYNAGKYLYILFAKVQEHDNLNMRCQNTLKIMKF